MKKLDIKTIFILILAIAVILLFIFRPSKPIKDYETEINKLKQDNIELVNQYSSLEKKNVKLDSILTTLNVQIDSTNQELIKSKNKIKNLQHKLNENGININTLSGDSVISKLSDYLQRRRN